MKSYILIDDPNSWFIPYGIELKNQLIEKGVETKLIQQASADYTGDICFMLSCIHLASADFLVGFRHNIVVHASDLPRGRGFSPLQWQILEGKNEITLTMLEADKEADHGPYYLKENITFEGYELLRDMREKMAKKIIQMCLRFAEEGESLPAVQQTGEGNFYRRRTEEDDRIDMEKSILEQWNHIRAADNERHPLWFEYMGHQYTLKIERKK